MHPDYAALDFLTGPEQSFVIYRIPDHAPVFLMQKEGLPEILNNPTGLNGKNGFVMAPFQIAENHPLVLIRPDLLLEGEVAIARYLAKIKQTAEKDSVDEPSDGSQPEDSFTNYKSAFELFQKALHAGSCDKIVLSRTYRHVRQSGFSIGKTFESACLKYPEAFTYLCHTPITGTWLGCSPEILLSGSGNHWQTVALAGTMKLNGKTPNWDKKNVKEQQIVSSYLEKQLRIKDFTCSISEPYATKAGNLMHLKTDFNFKMPDNSRIGELLDFLHPTPAVCGYPKTEAYRLILAQEGYDRSYYSGFTGPLSVRGKSHLCVNLRCTQIGPDHLTLYAGGGLMPDSELASEWEETEAKLQTMLSLMD
jgi:isochorismate synthase